MKIYSCIKSPLYNIDIPHTHTHTHTAIIWPNIALPCLGAQVKYLIPPSEPSFFPTGSSSSTPANVPLANSVAPKNLKIPACESTHDNSLALPDQYAPGAYRYSKLIISTGCYWSGDLTAHYHFCSAAYKVHK